jgi:hypothetical protein
MTDMNTSTSTDSKLPPDPEGLNGDRAEWAARALRTFQAATGTDRDDALADLLGDLMHLADRDGYDFDRELKRARQFYAEETTPLQESRS